MPSERSRRSRFGRSSTPITTATTRSATSCSPVPRSSGTRPTREASSHWGPPKSAPFFTEIEWGEIVLEPPFLTYSDSVTVWVDDLRAEVRFVGTAAHTTNDSVVWLPDRKLLYCGDLLFNGGTPFLLHGIGGRGHRGAGGRGQTAGRDDDRAGTRSRGRTGTHRSCGGLSPLRSGQCARAAARQA